MARQTMFTPGRDAPGVEPGVRRVEILLHAGFCGSPRVHRERVIVFFQLKILDLKLIPLVYGCLNTDTVKNIMTLL